jgi:GT2 family glycosyltransferase
VIEISFVVVSWNAKKYLMECLESIEREAIGYRYEIILVDNGSSDGSIDTVNKCFPSVILICNDMNLGFAKANNIGIRKCRGKYIFLINSDVKVLNGCFSSMIRFMELNPFVGILGPRVLNPDFTKQNSCKYFPTLANEFFRAIAMDTIFKSTQLSVIFKPHSSPDVITNVDVLSGCFWLVRKEAFDKVGLFDERFFFYAEDKDLCKRFKELGWQVVYNPEAQVIHYGGASSSNAPIQFYIEMQRANLQYWEKHYNRRGKYLYSIILFFYHVSRTIGYSFMKAIRGIEKESYCLKTERSVASLRWLFRRKEKVSCNGIPSGPETGNHEGQTS